MIEFQDNSEACKEALQKVYEKWLYAVGELLISAIKPLIPTDTGSLKNSINYKVDAETLSMTIGVNEEYAVYIEFGKKPVPNKNRAKSVNNLHKSLVYRAWNWYNIIMR